MGISALEELRRDKRYREATREPDYEYEIARKIIDARIERGLSQKELAVLIDTSQSTIARLESGEHMPSLTSLLKIAKALKTELLLPEFEFMQAKLVSTQSREVLQKVNWTLALPKLVQSFIRLVPTEGSNSEMEWRSL